MSNENTSTCHRTKASFLKQSVMGTIGAELVAAKAGRVSIRLPYHARLTQQNGFIHAGIISTIADSA